MNKLLSVCLCECECVCVCVYVCSSLMGVNVWPSINLCAHL